MVQIAVSPVQLWLLVAAVVAQAEVVLMGWLAVQAAVGTVLAEQMQVAQEHQDKVLRAAQATYLRLIMVVVGAVAQVLWVLMEPQQQEETAEQVRHLQFLARL